MKRRPTQRSQFCLLCFLLILVAGPHSVAEEPSPAAVAAFNIYVSAVESRLAHQHCNSDSFLVPQDEARLRRGEFLIEQLPTAEATGALLRHWRGSAFVPGATGASFNRLMRDFDAYAKHFAPEVVQARIISQKDDRIQAWMRVRQRHVLTVVMDTTYDIAYGQLDPRHGYSLSRSTSIAEIDASGSPLPPTAEHGFLWRLNTYWTYEERDGGLYLQVESISLSRAIPRGLAWAVQSYVESIPRESLEFTLRSTLNALRR